MYKLNTCLVWCRTRPPPVCCCPSNVLCAAKKWQATHNSEEHTQILIVSQLVDRETKCWLMCFFYMTKWVIVRIWGDGWEHKLIPMCLLKILCKATYKEHSRCLCYMCCNWGLWLSVPQIVAGRVLFIFPSFTFWEVQTGKVQNCLTGQSVVSGLATQVTGVACMDPTGNLFFNGTKNNYRNLHTALSECSMSGARKTGWIYF